MTTHVTVTSARLKWVILLAGLALVVTFALLPSHAFAGHCYVADKPNGAGAVTGEDLKIAGQSGKLVAPGAFVSTEETGLPNDVFIRGKDPLPPEAPPIVGGGELHHEPHHNGGEEHGVQEF